MTRRLQKVARDSNERDGLLTVTWRLQKVARDSNERDGLLTVTCRLCFRAAPHLAWLGLLVKKSNYNDNNSYHNVTQPVLACLAVTQSIALQQNAMILMGGCPAGPRRARPLLQGATVRERRRPHRRGGGSYTVAAACKMLTAAELTAAVLTAARLQ